MTNFTSTQRKACTTIKIDGTIGLLRVPSKGLLSHELKQWVSRNNARNDEICDNVLRTRAREAGRDPLGTVRHFYARLSSKGHVWFWRKIAVAMTTKHPWLVIACDSCGAVVDLDARILEPAV
jgi:hypothetical protein